MLTHAPYIEEMIRKSTSKVSPDEAMPIGRRGYPRAAVGMVVDVREETGEWQKAVLSNISQSGCMLDRLFQGLSGSSVWVRLPGAEPLAAEMKWKQGTVIGCKFRDRLNF
jgi:hypothetical protein